MPTPQSVQAAVELLAPRAQQLAVRGNADAAGTLGADIQGALGGEGGEIDDGDRAVLVGDIGHALVSSERTCGRGHADDGRQ